MMPLTYKFTVMPIDKANPFPIDMLRYDSCFPATSEDGMRIVASLRSHMTRTEASLGDELPNAGYRFAGRWITLDGLCVPTTKRWLSFGWKVYVDHIYNNRTGARVILVDNQ